MYRQVKVPLQFAILMVFASRGKVNIVSFYEPDELTPAIQRASVNGGVKAQFYGAGNIAKKSTLFKF
jgi:hypothetical protein